MKTQTEYRVETSYPWQKNQYRWLPEHEKLTLKEAQNIRDILQRRKQANNSKVKIRIIKSFWLEKVVK